MQHGRDITTNPDRPFRVVPDAPGPGGERQPEPSQRDERFSGPPPAVPREQPGPPRVEPLPADEAEPPPIVERAIEAKPPIVDPNPPPVIEPHPAPVVEPLPPPVVEPNPPAVEITSANGEPQWPPSAVDEPPVSAPPPASDVERTGTPGLTPPTRRGGSGRFITDHIVELGYATREQVESAIEQGRTTGIPPESVLLDANTIGSDELARATAERFGLDHIDLSSFEVDLGAVNLVPLQAAKRFDAVPVAFVDEGTLLVAMTDPTNVRAVDDISIMTGLDVRPAVASPDDVASVMSRVSKLDTAVAEAIEEGTEEEEVRIDDISVTASDAPVVKLVNGVIAQAVDEGASDVHFEPQPREMRVRYRVDGMLHDATTIPRRMVPGVISRLKIMGNLDIAERRLPQDGRISLAVEGHAVDVRVASLPAVHGEKIVLRLLDKEKALITLDKLGMQVDTLGRFRKSFMRPYGATLVTGPTGSGKTTSLYGALNIINTPERNIITVEDPVEYQIAGMTQIQVNVRAGLTFAQGLRSIVRADPDVIMVGEIRDRETAQIAIESALTGHLVLSTMHTNDAPSAITRLAEMEIEPFLTASAVDCVVSQRLARVLCSSCKERVVITADQLMRSDLKITEDIEAYEARGCQRCGGSGYKGRIGFYEAMIVTEELRQLVIGRASVDQLRAVAIEQGMRPLARDGLDKVRAGVTTIAEVARVTGSGVSAD